ncbi:phosphoribosylglycinamide formyltransferase [Prochlorococcus sp. MIT 1223]|uniref:phosphoribosylglycinamide formyltransferase n=1 Tax=Prochlorococcus sp. MIT 1223 TaxID=3096217 RepID=UPI002A74BE2A|nr:phosphoribosylglycinamide formyltransferase [Prochlorococcus sp. MIT 1223]
MVENGYQEEPIKKSNLINSITSTHNISYEKFAPPLRLAVLASGKGSNLEAIIKAIRQRKLYAEVVILIVNNENCNARVIASEHGIKCIYTDHRNFTDRISYDQNLVDILKRTDIDGIVMAGWMRIVSPLFIEAFPNRLINVHPSLLPSFKGSNAIKKALLSKAKITGCTIHKVIDEVDSGEIIAQAAVLISEDDDENSLKEKIQFQEHKLLPIAISIIGNEWRKETTVEKK